MNKETALKDLNTRLQIAQGMLASVNKIELNTVYKYKENHFDRHTMTERDFDSYRYFECFNRESARFVIIASDNPLYQDTKGRDRRENITALNYIYISKPSWKSGVITSGKINSLADDLTAVAENDLPLLIGMRYKSPEFEKVLKRKKKLKYA